MRVDEKGLVTIPKELRDAFAAVVSTELELEPADDATVVYKARFRPPQGKQLVERRGGQGDVRMSSEEIMALTRKS
jgi:bifunctional DNA-binding transcriptional regulator/antitoxin component of YhaV-PrlF toxin-antitoxin module